MRSFPILFAVYGLLIFAGLGCEPSEIEVSSQNVTPRAITPVSAPVSQAQDGVKMTLTEMTWLLPDTTIRMKGGTVITGHILEERDEDWISIIKMPNGSAYGTNKSRVEAIEKNDVKEIWGTEGEVILPLFVRYAFELLASKKVGGERWQVEKITVRQLDGRKPSPIGVGHSRNYMKVEGLSPTLPWITLEITVVNREAPPEEIGRFSSKLIFENLPIPAEDERLDVEKTLISKLGTKVTLVSVERRAAEMKCVLGIQTPGELIQEPRLISGSTLHPWWVDRQGNRLQQSRRVGHGEDVPADMALPPEVQETLSPDVQLDVVTFDDEPPPAATAFVLPFELHERVPALRQEKHTRHFIFHLALPKLPALPVTKRPPAFASQRAGDVTVTLEGFRGDTLWFTTKTAPKTVTKGTWLIKEIEAKIEDGHQSGRGWLVKRKNWYPNGEPAGTDEVIQTWDHPPTVQELRGQRVAFQLALGREKSKILKLSGLPVPPRGEEVVSNKKIRIERRMNLVLEEVRRFASANELTGLGLQRWVRQTQGLALVFRRPSRWTNLDVLSAHDDKGKELVKVRGFHTMRGNPFKADGWEQENRVTVFLRAPFPKAKTFDLELLVDYYIDQKTITFEDLENVRITVIDNFKVSPQAVEVFHMTKEEREVLDQAIDKARNDFAQTVTSYTTVEYPPDGGVLLHISPFPEKGESIQQSLDSAIKAVLGESRFERFHKLAQDDFEKLFYHFGKADYTVKISKPSEWDPIQIKSRYRIGNLASGSSSSTQQHIPEKYRYFIDLMPPELLPYYSGTSR